MQAHDYHDTKQCLNITWGWRRSVCDSNSFGRRHILQFIFDSITCGFLPDKVRQQQVNKEFKIPNKLSCSIKTQWHTCFAFNTLHCNFCVLSQARISNLKPDTYLYHFCYDATVTCTSLIPTGNSIIYFTITITGTNI